MTHRKRGDCSSLSSHKAHAETESGEFSRYSLSQVFCVGRSAGTTAIYIRGNAMYFLAPLVCNNFTIGCPCVSTKDDGASSFAEDTDNGGACFSY
mmetsp:Transcript_37034/g.75185  ORF Transcript_37034/g.75185 Transcript_37034/m.75185 type:complete len:95 (+) Transcript_37034:836-1120(+)